MTIKRILIAVDDSEYAANAAKVGVELARSLGGAIGLINVFDPTVGPEGVWGVSAERVAEMSEKASKDLLESFRRRTTNGCEIRGWSEAGAPASKIIEVAKSWPADLLVVGSHGRGKVGGLVLGSVSQAILHHACCPVLVVR